MIGAITITQPIFTGGKIINGNKLAKLDVEVNKQQIRINRNNILFEVETFYWQLICLYEKQITLEIIKEQLEELLKNVNSYYDTGLGTKNDVLRVQLQINDLNNNIIDLKNNIDIIKLSLCLKMGIDDKTNFELNKPNIQTITPPCDIFIDHEAALTSRAENRLVSLNVQATKLNTKLKRSDYLPTVAIGATYYKHNFMNKWNDNSLVHISVKVPISGWWGGSHAVNREKLKENIAYNNKVDTQEQLLLQMQKTKYDLENCYKQVLISLESVEQATENLRLNNDHYKVGMTTLADVLDAQSLLQNSRDRYTEKYTNYQTKRSEYIYITGQESY
jgi:outer membrane protein TolC